MNLKKNKNRPVNVQKRSVSESAADCRLHGSQETSEQAAAAAQRGSVHTAKEAHGAPRHLPYCTGAQAIQLLHNLKENFCDLDAVLIMKDFPSTMALKDCELREDKSTFTTKDSDYFALL